jgi:hypothetical protein
MREDPGLQGRPVPARSITVPGKDGQRASDLFGRDFTAPARTRRTRQRTDFTYVAGLVWDRLRRFIVDIC